MPIPTGGAKVENPTMLATTSKSQLQFETNLRMRCWVFTPEPSVELKISQFFDGQSDISYGRGNPEQEKYNGQPRPGFKSQIKETAYTISDEDSQSDLQTQAAEIGQLFDITPISFFQ